MCLPAGMTDAQVERFSQSVTGQRRIKAGQTLYHQGDAFHTLYAIRSGTLKSSLMLPDSREQVSGFHIAGEQVGLDGIAHATHATSAMALEDTEVCAITYAGLVPLMLSIGGGHLLSRMMSREIVRDQRLLLMLGSMNSAQRLAGFLLNLAGRLKGLGYASGEFHLRMTRADIGSLLCMKIETVSRMFSAFQKQRLLKVDKRHIRILDAQGLASAFAAPPS
jgi:CRP/FNR family transcriptional regulator